jgi:VanZ family protein
MRRILGHASFWYVIGSLLVLLVTYTSLAPASELPQVALNDKVEHALAYAGMALWFGGLLQRRHYLLLAIALIVFGGAIEIAQGAMQLGRTADVLDWAADSAGVALGLGACLLGLGQWVSWIERLTRRP